MRKPLLLAAPMRPIAQQSRWYPFAPDTWWLRPFAKENLARKFEYTQALAVAADLEPAAREAQFENLHEAFTRSWNPFNTVSKETFAKHHAQYAHEFGAALDFLIARVLVQQARERDGRWPESVPELSLGGSASTEHEGECCAMNALEQLFKAGQTAQAKAAAEKVLERQPQDVSALVVLSKVLLLEGQLDKAEQHLVRAEQTGATAETLLLRANLAAQRGQLPPAAGYFRQVIDREPQRAEAHFGLGLVLFKDGEAEEGLLSLEKAVKLEPENPLFVYRLGQVRLEAGYTDRGIQLISQAITLQPRFLAPYLSLTQALMEQNRIVEAKKVLQDGLRAIPNHPRLLAMTTALAVGIGDAMLSYVAAKTLANQRPKDPEAQANLALLLLLRGQHEEALLLCRTMEGLGLATADLKMIEATVYEAAEPPAYDKAEAAYEQAMGLDPHGWKAPNNLGILLLRMPADPPDQHLPRALTVLQEAVRRNPNQPEPHLNLALAYTRMGDKENARVEAMTVLAAGLPEGHAVREEAQRLLSTLG